jgi:hypothetical protein
VAHAVPAADTARGAGRGTGHFGVSFIGFINDFAARTVGADGLASGVAAIGNIFRRR